MADAPPSPAPRVSVVVVTWNEGDAVGRSLPAVADQLRDGDELIVVDNGSEDGTPDAAARVAPAAMVLRNRENRGFMAAVNAGARAASGDLLVLLNPDAVVAEGWREGIERPWTREYGWAAWQALVTSEGGRLVNTAGNELHFTGIAWAGRAGLPVGAVALEPREIPYASGACLALPLAAWRQLGGFPEYFFLYGDDADLCLRLRLRGERIGIEPAARVDHEYEFLKARRKWRFLERTRWAFVLRTYPAALLVLVAPALAATELALLAVAAAGGWLDQKLLATADVVRWLPRLARERRAIQATRRISAAEFAAWLTPDLSSAYLPAGARGPLPRALLRGYWALVRTALGRA
jgi:GT2 family glycosyltransferase